MENINRLGFVRPREFQSKAMPVIMDGFDLKGQAETGSGKTAAFLLPLIHKLHTEFKDSTEDRGTKVSVLIVEPTREMADQVFTELRKFSNSKSVWVFEVSLLDTSIRVAYSFGKMEMKDSISIINKGCDILVVSPGRGGNEDCLSLIDVITINF